MQYLDIISKSIQEFSYPYAKFRRDLLYTYMTFRARLNLPRGLRLPIGKKHAWTAEHYCSGALILSSCHVKVFRIFLLFNSSWPVNGAILRHGMPAIPSVSDDYCNIHLRHRMGGSAAEKGQLFLHFSNRVTYGRKEAKIYKDRTRKKNGNDTYLMTVIEGHCATRRPFLMVPLRPISIFDRAIGLTANNIWFD